MYLIVGLGNPDREYAGTRHNAGFEAIKVLANRNNIKIGKVKHRAFIGEGVVCGEKVLLAMPQTYMNLSGESVRDLMNYLKLGAENLIVVYDDTALPVGAVRIRERGSAGGHNGIKNILFHLETDEFLRVKVGIGEKPQGWQLSDYVLGKFKQCELEAVIEGITKAAEAIEALLSDGAATAMNKYNVKLNGETTVQKPEKKPTAEKKAEEETAAPSCETSSLGRSSGING